jgi:hypothetical protein
MFDVGYYLSTLFSHYIFWILCHDTITLIVCLLLAVHILKQSFRRLITYLYDSCCLYFCEFNYIKFTNSALTRILSHQH